MILGFSLLLVSSGVDLSRCDACHETVVEAWKTSLHARAMEDPVFLNLFREASRDLQESCLACHDPEERGEGVTCATCHGVEGEAPHTTAGAQAPTVDSLPHPVVVKESLGKADHCARCHQFANPQGLAVFNTYEEWKQGPYAVEGMQCQNCHMPEDPTRTPVDPRFGSRLAYHEHSFRGGHALSQVRKALELTPLPPRQDGAVWRFVAEVTNKEAGHAFPTGLPTRRGVVRFLLLDREGQVLFEDSTLFVRVIADAEGRVLSDFLSIFARGARVISDTRLGPRETRTLTFEVPRDVARRARFAEFRIYYDFGNLPLPEGMEQLVLVTHARLDIRPHGPFRGVYAFAGVLVVAVILVGIALSAGKKEASR